MPVEDFSQAYWVETDLDNRITVVGTNHVDFQAYRGDNDAYFKRDVGAGHFTNFDHKINVKLVSVTGGNAMGYFWMVSNDVDDVLALNAASKNFITLIVGQYGGTNYLMIAEFYGGTEYDSSPYTPTFGTWYYLWIKKAGTAFTCEIYDTAANRDAHGATGRLATLSLTLKEDTSKRYVFVCNTWNSGHETIWEDVDIENLDLQEVAGINFDAVGSGTNGGGATTVTWTHIVGSSSNRLMLIGVSIRTTTVTVSSITVGSQSATFIRGDNQSTNIRAEVWYLKNPTSGSQTVTVTLSASSKACGGSCTYTGVDQTNTFDTNAGNNGSSTTPNATITLAGASEWTFHNIAWQGTATVSSHDSGQTHRWNQVTTGGAASTKNTSDGDDKAESTSGSKTYQITLSASSYWAMQVVAFNPVTAGVTYPVNVSETSISVGDSPSYNVRRVMAVSESLGTPSDAVTRIFWGYRTVSEPSISAGDAVTAGLFKSISVSESLGSPSDSASYTLRRTVSISEPTISMSDSPVYTLRRDKAVSEPAISVSDGIVRVLWAYRTLSEPSISASDSVARGLFLNRSLSEPTVSVSDSLNYNMRRAVSISEASITVSDGVTRVFWAYRTISEPSISVSDAVTATKGIVSIDVSEVSISVSDQAIRVLWAYRSVSEPSISASDSASYNLRRVTSISEPSITISDATGIILHRIVSISEPTISVSDGVIRLFWAYRTIQEPTVSATDAVSAEKLVPLSERSVSEPSISVSDSPSYMMIRARIINESFGVGVYDSVLITSNGKILLRLSPATKTPPNYLEVG
jgi:hypothetical protein